MNRRRLSNSIISITINIISTTLIIIFFLVFFLYSPIAKQTFFITPLAGTPRPQARRNVPCWGGCRPT